MFSEWKVVTIKIWDKFNGMEKWEALSLVCLICGSHLCHTHQVLLPYSDTPERSLLLQMLACHREVRDSRLAPTKRRLLKKHWKLINSWEVNHQQPSWGFYCSKKNVKMDFKENNKTVICREPYSVILKKVAQRLRKNARTAMIKICEDSTESRRGNKRSFWEDAGRQIRWRTQKAKNEDSIFWKKNW